MGRHPKPSTFATFCKDGLAEGVTCRSCNQIARYTIALYVLSRFNAFFLYALNKRYHFTLFGTGYLEFR
jgi:hypothetical protein